MRFICQRNGADTGRFTDGKAYEARPIGSGRVYEVVDDIGHTRVISPGPRCPHMVRRWTMTSGSRGYHYPMQTPVGAWYSERIDQPVQP